MLSEDTVYDVDAEAGYVYRVVLVATVGGLLFGYDTGVISGCIGFLVDKFELSAAAQGWAASSALIGCIFGAAMAGTLSDRFGRRRIMMLAALLFTISAIGSALPRNLTELVIARMIGGLGVGMASLLSPLYISELSPARIRGRLVSLNQLAIVIGFLVVYFANAFIQQLGDEAWNIEYGWRWMFGSETLPAGLFVLLLFFVPESPRWLTKQGREKDAMNVLRRVSGDFKAREQMREIRQAIALEGGSIFQLFAPGLRIALLIAVVLAVLQQITGINAILYYAPEIFKQAGAGQNSAFIQTVAVGAVNCGFTLVAIFTVDKLGRKALLIFGSGGMGLFLFMLAFAFNSGSAGSWVLVCILGYIACFAMSMGPVVWVVISEIFPTRIRGRAMAVGTVFLWCACYLVSQTFPMLNEGLGAAGTFAIYGVMCVAMVIFTAVFVPETREKTLEEIEAYWRR
jgi:sugar porter (SP) family MFS transporter